MTDVASVLRAANIKHAAIIDDAYESVPLSKDLSEDEDQWVQFFEDLNEEDKVAIRETFTSFDKLRGDQLRASDEFVGTLWNLRKALRPGLTGELFARYTRLKDQDLVYLEALTTKLTEYGLDCSNAPNLGEEHVDSADLIVVDLFLGATQDDDAIKKSIAGLNRLLQARAAKPPLVILMSRSSRLEEKREQFRNEAGLFESAFRIIRKTELREEGKLARLLLRLSEHYEDTLRLTRFLYAWQRGLTAAGKRTCDLIRTLDLADLAQIRQLLLADESEKPGSYLVDVFDLVLQHEVEREVSIIDAAADLNAVDLDAYPPPYVTGSPDLQAIAYRCLFQNRERLRLRADRGNLVGFGDVLRRKDTLAPEVAAEGSLMRFSEFGRSDVFLVLTPSCDLQRLAMERILLLKGSLVRLTHANWFDDGKSARTAVFETATNDRFQIRWNLKHIETLSCEELSTMLELPAGFDVVGRLRESHSLEIQQKLLSSLGRIGLLASMPGTFPVKIEAYIPDLNKRLVQVDIPDLTKNQGVLFSGRKNGKPAMTLVLCEDACEGLYDAIGSVDLNAVHPTTRVTVNELRATDELLVLQKGVDVCGLSSSKFLPVVVERQTEGVERKAEKQAIALIRKRGDWLNEELKNSELRQAGVVLVITEEESDGETPTLARVIVDVAADAEQPRESPDDLSSMGQ